MTGVQWLKLDKTNLSTVPEEMGKLVKLENLSMKGNNLDRLYGELTDLNCLRSLNLRRKKVKTSSVPAELFKLEELTTLDLSHNNLREVPAGMETARSLLVLNLSHNSIAGVPSALFMHLTDLLFLDLSHNQLETLPPQTRRLANLQTLILSHNPLGHFQFRQLPSLQSLAVLHMRATQRTLNNIPASLEALTSLVELDLAQNDLPRVPDALFTLPNLKRPNLADNKLTDMPQNMEVWQNLENLNLCRNELTALPAALCKLNALRRLYVNDNQLDFEGIPSGMGKLGALEVFSAANNKLEMVPEGLFRFSVGSSLWPAPGLPSETDPQGPLGPLREPSISLVGTDAREPSRVSLQQLSLFGPCPLWQLVLGRNKIPLQNRLFFSSSKCKLRVASGNCGFTSLRKQPSSLENISAATAPTANGQDQARGHALWHCRLQGLLRQEIGHQDY
ncbi:protein flightless-1-like [Neocloeon triangulifer]|uniref:protein flightless-1-like n=1 Tax=Neocloeon triangulifer TaxID=2078957 RepID=UPI00286F9CEB|nr:protein flightless-1-like [Neocloeon triangulifer]